MTRNEGSDNAFSATIPAADAAPGNMVRWAIEAGSYRDPEWTGGWDRKYYGTIVQDTSDTASLPVVEL